MLSVLLYILDTQGEVLVVLDLVNMLIHMFNKHMQ